MKKFLKKLLQKLHYWIKKINEAGCPAAKIVSLPDALNSQLIKDSEMVISSNGPEGRKIKIVFGCGGDRDKYKRAKMGSIANEYCSKIFLTDDNPRFENPKKIRKDIKKNISSKKVLEIPNRNLAIRNRIA